MPSTLGCFDDGFNGFSQNPTLFAISENLKTHGSLRETLLVSAKLVNFDGFS